MTETIQKRKIKPAAWFLLIITGMLVVIITGRIWWESNPIKVLNFAYTPSTDISSDPKLPAPDYSKEESWLVHPKISNEYAILRRGGNAASADAKVDVFFLHPTSGFSNKQWNAAYDDPEANSITNALSIKHQLSAFNQSARMYAPKYRQANFGAYFERPIKNNIQAFDLAYKDLEKAFDHFINYENQGRPFIIASHSQGSMHALPLIMNKLKGTQAEKRLIAAYIIGWPISVEADLPAIGLSPCQTATDTGCIIGWQTFGKGGDPYLIKEYLPSTQGLTGQPRRNTNMLCTNPLTWENNGAADASHHLGALELYMDSKRLPEKPQDFFGASCIDNGILELDRLLKGNVWEQYQMSGFDFHTYDYNLFYYNLIENVKVRIQQYLDQK